MFIFLFFESLCVTLVADKFPVNGGVVLVITSIVEFVALLE